MKLNGYLAFQTLKPIEKKGFFSKRYVLFGEFICSAQWMYETCSILGYLYRDRFLIFLELLAEDGRQNDLINYISEPATDRLLKLSKEPQNFYDLFFESEVTSLMKKMHSYRLIQYSEFQDFIKIFKNKIRLDYFLTHLQLLAGEGIGFGYKYPELTEKFFESKYDEKEWKKWNDYGLDIGSKPPAKIPFTTLQSNAKALITPFVEKVRPDLLDTLGLK